MQLFSAMLSFILMVLNLFGPVFKFLGLIISSIPGSKTVLKFIPFVGNKKEINCPPGDEWKKGRIERREMWQQYRNDPVVIERQKIERMSKTELVMYRNNKNLIKIQHSQPANISIKVIFRV